MTVSEYITKRREELGWSMEDLAINAKVNRSTVWRAENVTEPSITTLIKLINAMGCSLVVKNKKSYINLNNQPE